MTLQRFVDTYGCVDYYEMNTGRVFHLSDVKNEPDGIVKVPVSEDGNFIGYAEVKKGM